MSATYIIGPWIPSAADLETKLRRQRHGKQQRSNDPDGILVVKPALPHSESELRFLATPSTSAAESVKPSPAEPITAAPPNPPTPAESIAAKSSPAEAISTALKTLESLA